MAGRIAVRGPIRQMDGRAAGHVRIRLQTMARYAARNAVVRMLPVSSTLWPAARNVLRAALLRIETCGRAACGKLIWNARLPPRVSRLILTSPCSAVFSERFGRTPYFRHWPPCAAHRANSGAREKACQTNSLYQHSVTVGADVTERACGRRPCPLRDPCVQLVASRCQGEQPAPGASKMTIYRLLPAQTVRFGAPRSRSNRSNAKAGRAGTLGKLYSE